MGGTSALIYAMRHPATFDGVLSMCPATDPAEFTKEMPNYLPLISAAYGGSPEEIPEEYLTRTARNHVDALSQFPLVIIHGTGDKIIPFSHSKVLVEALRKNGAPLLFKEISGGNHDSPLHIPMDEVFDFLEKNS